MKATLNIYNSIEDQEPSKVFTCYRTTMAINDKLEDLTEEINDITKQIHGKAATITDETPREEIKKIKKEIKALEEKASQLTFESIQMFFPHFTQEDFMKLDPYDYQTFCFEVGEMRGKVYNRAQKN